MVKQSLIPKGVVLMAAVLLLGSTAFAETPVKNYAASTHGLKKLLVGEKAAYSISYFGVPIGSAVAEVREKTMMHGRPAYHIVVHVVSTSVVDLIYKVRGEHHTYLDAEKLCSLRYEIRSMKDASKVVFQMDTNPESLQTEYHYFKRDIRKKVATLKGAQDRLSMGFYFRTLDLSPHQTLSVPVQTKEKNWKLKIQTNEIQPMTIKKIGNFQALEAVPTLDFISTLKMPGSVRGWVSMDERRIPLLIRAKAPLLGSVTVKLTSYTPGHESVS